MPNTSDPTGSKGDMWNEQRRVEMSNPTNTPETIDEVVNTFELGLYADVTINDASKTKAELKAALSAMVAEIIGEDDNAISPRFHGRGYDVRTRNILRAKQRTRAAKMGFDIIKEEEL